LIHDPEKVYRGRVATGNTLCWWLHSLSLLLLQTYWWLLYDRPHNPVDFRFTVVLDPVFIFENASGGAA
jgi:hypothetical protein